MAEGLNNRLKNWRETLEDNGLRVSREKTEYLRCDFGNVEIAHYEEVDICIGDKILQPKESFRYLGSMMHKSGRIDKDVFHRKLYGVAIRPSMLYGLKCWPIMKALANRMEVAELRMLRWTCSKTMFDMIPNGVYKEELEMETIMDKMREGRLRWFGHVRKRPQSASSVRRVEALVVDSLIRMGRPKLWREDRVKLDIKELLLSKDMTSDWNERVVVLLVALFVLVLALGCVFLCFMCFRSLLSPKVLVSLSLPCFFMLALVCLLFALSSLALLCSLIPLAFACLVPCVLPCVWAEMSKDFIDGLLMLKDRTLIMVVVDRLSNYSYFIPLTHPCSTIQMADAFLDIVYNLNGLSKIIVSDRDDVFVSDRDVVFMSRQVKYHKLSAKYFGPFQIVQRIGKVACKLKLCDSAQIHPVFHVSLIKKYKGRLPIAPGLHVALSYAVQSGLDSVLQVFYLALGLKINIHKSNVYGSGVLAKEVSYMVNNTGCAFGSFPFVYLGLPIGSNMSFTSNWKTLIDRFHAILSTRKANILSIGGRLTLIKAVHGSRGIYFLPIFNVPESILKSLERIRALFFWSLKSFNLALLQKWRILVRMPFGLKSARLCMGKKVDSIISGAKQIVYGQKSLVPLITYTRVVSSLVIPYVFKWDVLHSDTCVCPLAMMASFLLDDRTLTDSPMTWDTALPRKVNIFMWRYRLDRLPHRLNLSSRGIEILEISFPSCNGNVESKHHIFFECDITKDIWRLIRVCCDNFIPLFASNDHWRDWLSSWSTSTERRFIVCTSLLSLHCG
ncbi:retrovirus-related pol polyprotein LINE-1 [Tanacetum coccineum]